jgi:hypothetical protein
MNPVLQSILSDIENQTLDAAKTAGKAAMTAAISDTKDFLVQALPRLERWFQALLDKNITEDEFKSLLLGLKDLAFVNALTVAGIAEIEIDKTRNTILQTLTSVASSAAGKLIAV